MKKVYIIDDDRNIVESLTIILESEGYQVESQFDEENSVENIAKSQADIIILDVMFPEDDTAGFKIARKIKDADQTKDIPVLMLSAINEKGIAFSNKDIDEAYLPVNEFVEKPIDPKELLAKVKKMTEE